MTRAWMAGIALLATATGDSRPRPLLIVGAGIAGLSAALEAARAGAEVTVIEMSTVPGGHAILSNGAVCLVATPLQAKNKVEDSPDLARRDFHARGEDADPAWVDLYVRDSRAWIHDWLTDMGVTFDALVKPPGNSVPRLHLARGKGWGLVEPLYRACLRQPGITFVWATKAERLIVEDGAVVGVVGKDLRSGAEREYRARDVVVATGGFQSSLELVRKHWPGHLPPPPDRLLLGAAGSATGSGHTLVEQVGGALSRMDHQWNYVLGLPDPRDPGGRRGLAAFNFNSVWVNAEGRRFTREFGDPKQALADLLRQPGGTYWSVFDENGKRGFAITLAGFEDFDDVRKLVYESGLAVGAGSLDDLADKVGLPRVALAETVRRYNQLAEEGLDHDFQAFGPATFPRPRKIDTPPFYAVQFFPITRKSMGGVLVDLQCRVLDREARPIRGLYAAGEVTGFGGLNGRAALEGTFLGPSVLMGRIAARHASAGLQARAKPSSRAAPEEGKPVAFPNQACARCHDIGEDVKKARPGFWHYEQSHARVLARREVCSRCHGGLFPYRKSGHKLDRSSLIFQCVVCHGVQSSTPPAVP